jgi:hypothetical protein
VPPCPVGCRTAFGYLYREAEEIIPGDRTEFDRSAVALKSVNLGRRVLVQ